MGSVNDQHFRWGFDLTNRTIPVSADTLAMCSTTSTFRGIFCPYYSGYFLSCTAFFCSVRLSEQKIWYRYPSLAIHSSASNCAYSCSWSVKHAGTSSRSLKTRVNTWQRSYFCVKQERGVFRTQFLAQNRKKTLYWGAVIWWGYVLKTR
jgi:hypothetical protein